MRSPTPGHAEIDADGLLVTPGFVDVHTHYDGQVTWDSMVAPSSIHGVTSVVMGNCGVGFAPARPGDQEHAFLIELMEGVEDIPGTALSDGLPWSWESFPEYLDAVDARPHTLDIGAQVPHAAMRAYVMGERGADHELDPTPDEIAQMSEIVAEALQAGAMGFATSRSLAHRTVKGKKIGTLTARNEELMGVADAFRRTGLGVLQFVSDFKDLDGELSLMRRIGERAGRPLSVSLAQFDPKPDNWRRVLDWIENAAAEGSDFKAQTCIRPIGILLGLNGSIHPFVRCPAYKEIRHQPVDEQVRRMQDPTLRRTLLEQAKEVRGGIYRMIATRPQRVFRLGDPPDYEPGPEKSIGATAERAGLDPMELMYDVLCERAGEEMLYCPIGNYSYGDLEVAREMISSDRVILGLSDGGAHVGTICDGSMPTFNLYHWTRDRTRGPQLPLEAVVKAQTRDTAAHVGWDDRGLLAAGYLADVNVIDMDELNLRPPRMIYDLPTGARRLMQDAVGYHHTIKAGAVTFEAGEHTGELPGRLVRGAQPAPS